MKRWICSILVVVLLLPVLSATAFAHGHGSSYHRTSVHCKTDQGAKKNTCVDSCQYADENGDNICDNCENKCPDCGKTRDENADGICDSCGKCFHYQDKDGNGACDHQEDCANRKDAQKPKTVKKTGCHTVKHKNHH